MPMSASAEFRPRLLLASLLSCFGVAAQAEVHVHESRADYVLAAHEQGELREEWLQAMQVRGPGAASRSHGLTRSNLEVQFRLLPLGADRCALDEVQVKLSLEFDVPRWQPVETPSEALRARVDAVWSRVEEHGRQHRDNAERAAREIDESLAALEENGECKSLQRQAERIVDRRLARLWAQQRRYDERSDLQAQLRVEAVVAAKKQDSDNKLRGSVTDRRGRRTAPGSLVAVGM